MRGPSTIFPYLRALLVCLDVEIDEETEVAGEQEAAEERSALGASTGAHVRKFVREVCRREI